MSSETPKNRDKANLMCLCVKEKNPLKPAIRLGEPVSSACQKPET